MWHEAWIDPSTCWVMLSPWSRTHVSSITSSARDNVASIRAEEKPAIAGFVQAVQWT
jgi:hypothetical protein